MALLTLSAEDKKNISAWTGIKNCRLNLVYSADRDGCSPAAFHAKCNNISPLLVVASNTAGYVFGGYASVPWIATNSYPSDPNAFLFHLKKANNTSYMKFPAINATTSTVTYTNYGPMFGNTSGSIAMTFFQSAIVKQAGQNFFDCPNLIVNFGYGFQNNGQDNNALHGGNNQLINIEVYTLQEGKMCDAGNEWRKGMQFAEATLAELKQDLTKFQPPKQLGIPKANILIVGQVGAGKSSFYNTLNSCYRGHVTGKAACGSAEHSVTSQFRQYELRPGRGEQGLKLRLCDTMGLEDDQGLNITDIPYILDGHVQNGFQFNPAVLVTPEHPDYHTAVKSKDRIHVVALVIDATTAMSMSTKLLDKLRQIRKHATQRNLPCAVILTKVDEVDEDVSEDVSLVFRSLTIKEHLDTIADKLGILRSFIHPVKNYSCEVELEAAVDILSLYALRQLTRLAEDYFEDQMEQKGFYDTDDK